MNSTSVTTAPLYYFKTSSAPSKQTRKHTSKQQARLPPVGGGGGRGQALNKQTNKQTSKQTNKQTNKQANKQTNKQTNEYTKRSDASPLPRMHQTYFVNGMASARWLPTRTVSAQKTEYVFLLPERPSLTGGRLTRPMATLNTWPHFIMWLR